MRVTYFTVSLTFPFFFAPDISPDTRRYHISHITSNIQHPTSLTTNSHYQLSLSTPATTMGDHTEQTGSRAPGANMQASPTLKEPSWDFSALDARDAAPAPSDTVALTDATPLPPTDAAALVDTSGLVIGPEGDVGSGSLDGEKNVAEGKLDKGKGRALLPPADLGQPALSLPRPQAEGVASAGPPTDKLPGPSKWSAKSIRWKGHAHKPNGPAGVGQHASSVPSQAAGGSSRPPGILLTTSSNTTQDAGGSSQPPGILLTTSSNTTHVPYSVIEGDDDYPHVSGPRSIYTRGNPPYERQVHLPRPQDMHHHRYVTKYAGEPLFRLCSSVPYVLGPLSLVMRLQLIVETPILLPDEAQALLAARGLDEPNPFRKSQWLTQGLATQCTEEKKYTDQRLELYFLRRHAVVQRRYCNVLEFIVHMRRWRQLPNPAKVLDYAGGNLSWIHIVDRLKRANIEAEKLDGGLYEELRDCETYEALTAKIREIKQLQTDGVLERRYKEWQDQGDAIVDSQLKDETNRKTLVSLNNKRFSHRHPLGVDVNDPEASMLDLTAHGTATQQMQLAACATPRSKWKWTCGACTALKQALVYPAWRYIIFTSVVFIPLLTVLVYLWIKGPSKGCGEMCLDH
ncbi:hypothetical protein C7974DRAFT_416328 [Boeremia exigua]|uniref:uncharacterized protein n=1 Tax=Boeremia exigua TaxID=749465 RepID=UPI001E8DE82F|nr:uncharacterized protein C7974DRAFT_416328 [Boeremia exigua]KAH6618994.1 hypothetical protein C7974DRAFT_416328 [Boeremia exigua]